MFWFDCLIDNEWTLRRVLQDVLLSILKNKYLNFYPLVSVRSNILMFRFQELPVILFLIIVVTPLQPKIRIMTAIAVTVLCYVREPGGTIAVITPTWTVTIITENTRDFTVSIGEPGKDIATPWRELRWKSDQWCFKSSDFFHFSMFAKKSL